MTHMIAVHLFAQHVFADNSLLHAFLEQTEKKMNLVFIRMFLVITQ